MLTRCIPFVYSVVSAVKFKRLYQCETEGGTYIYVKIRFTDHEVAVTVFFLYLLNRYKLLVFYSRNQCFIGALSVFYFDKS